MHCDICNEDFDRLLSHIKHSHPDVMQAQETLVLKYYSDGYSARSIAFF